MSGALAVCLLTSFLVPAHAGAALAKGDLIVADARAFGGGGLIQVDPQTGAESVLSSNEMAINSSHRLFARPYVLAIGYTGRIYVASSTNLGGSCASGCGGRHARGVRRCTFWKRLGALTVRGRAGRNAVAFSGAIARGRLLRPGRYRLAVSAANVYGSTSGRRALRFTVVR